MQPPILLLMFPLQKLWEAVAEQKLPAQAAKLAAQVVLPWANPVVQGKQVLNLLKK